MLGPNGADKSILMRSLAIITEGTSGKVKWNGVDIAKHLTIGGRLDELNESQHRPVHLQRTSLTESPVPKMWLPGVVVAIIASIGVAVSVIVAKGSLQVLAWKVVYGRR